MKRDTAIRIPRPLGVTAILQEYHKTKNQDTLIQAKQYIIQQWLISNGKFSGMVLNLNDLASFLKVDPEMIRLQMRDTFLQTKLWNKELQESLLESLVGQQIVWAMEDRMEVDNQVGVLRDSQGRHYTPFVTAELNKAIGMKISTTNTLAGIIRSLSGGGSVNIFNQTNTQNNIAAVGVTVQEAIEIIQSESRALDAPQQVQYIENHYPTEEFPEVVAHKQTGMDVTREGLNLSQGELLQIADDYKGTIKAFDDNHHEIRREIELGIDPDEVDPELEVYPA